MPAKNLYRERKEGIYAHIYNKGVENRAIFNDKEDYVSFQGFLKDYLTAPQDPESIKKSFTVYGRIFRGIPHQPKNYFNKVELIAYSLMPGHFHLLLHQKTRDSVESFIRSLCTRYSIYFNKKYQRTGALFEGPYKSIQIKDGARMLHLTRFLHRAGGPSSYTEYLGAKEAVWVKPKVVLSFFDKGVNSYKDFVEKYEPDPKVKELLEGFTFESEIQHLERRDLTRDAEDHLPEISPESSEKIYLGRTLKFQQRIPELVATVVIFLLLVTFGARNVMISTAKSLNPSTPSTVLSATEEIKPTVSISKSPNPPPSPTVLPTEGIELKMTLTVKIDDGAASVNIRQKPTVNSEKIGLAKDGDILEYVWENPEWYEIKLATMSGFISAKYVEASGGNQ